MNSTDTHLAKAFELIDRIVTNDIEYGFPSAQIAVMRNGRFVYENAWGKSITRDTLFDLASNTKPYSVIYSIQYLASRGLIDVDTPIAALVGERFAEDTLSLEYSFDDAEHIDIADQKRWKRLTTVRDVLCHRAGLPAGASFLLRKDYKFIDSETNPFFAGCDATEKTRAKVLDVLCRLPLCYQPRTRVVYSDTDYILLSLIIEKLICKDMQAFLSETFWKPLGLKHICYNPLEHGFSKEGCAPTELHGNTRDGAVYFDGIRTETVQGQVHDESAYYAMAGISGNAGLFANAHDLALLANVMLDSKGFFTDEVKNEFTSPASEDHDEWGLGWYRQGKLKRTHYFSALAGENTIGHQGWTGTLSVIDPKEQLVIALLTSKRNTPVTDPSVNPNAFDGCCYTTADLGFASPIIYDALYGRSFDSTLEMLVARMKKQLNDSPCRAAELALASILKTQTEQSADQASR